MKITYIIASIALVTAVSARIICAEQFEDLNATEREHSIMQWCRCLSELAMLVSGIVVLVISFSHGL